MGKNMMSVLDRIFNLLDTGLLLYALYRLERILAQSVANFRAILSLIERRASFRPPEDIPAIDDTDPRYKTF